MTEPAVFISAVAKQHDLFVGVIASVVLASARASFRLDEILRKLFKDLPKLALLPTHIFFVTLRSNFFFFLAKLVVLFHKILDKSTVH